MGKDRYRELIRGIYNQNFNTIVKEKNYKKVIENLWVYFYDQIRINIGKKDMTRYTK